MWRNIMRRDIYGFLIQPVALVVIVAYVAASHALALYFGGFFERNQADLDSFFAFTPWLLMIFMPALAMRSFAEEVRQGTIELLRTLPIRETDIVIGKFLALLAILAAMLFCNVSLWLSMAYLGQADHMVMFSGFIASLLLGGVYLAISCFASILTRNQVIAFILGLVFCFVLTMIASPMVLGFLGGYAPLWILDVLTRLSFLNYFVEIQRGLLTLPALFTFFGFSGYFLWLTYSIMGSRR